MGHKPKAITWPWQQSFRGYSAGRNSRIQRNPCPRELSARHADAQASVHRHHRRLSIVKRFWFPVRVRSCFGSFCETRVVAYDNDPGGCCKACRDNWGKIGAGATPAIRCLLPCGKKRLKVGPGRAFSKRGSQARTKRATIRRVIGATISTAGNATAQLASQAPNQCAGNAASIPSARQVAMPDTMADISPDRIKPKRIGANRAGIIPRPFFCKNSRRSKLKEE